MIDNKLLNNDNKQTLLSQQSVAPLEVPVLTISGLRQFLLRSLQLSVKALDLVHRATGGAVAGTIGTLMIEHFLGDYDLNPETISRAPINVSVISIAATAMCFIYILTAPSIKDELAELNPELDLHLLSNISKLKDLIKHKKGTKNEAIQEIKTLRMYIEYLVTAAAVNESRFSRYLLLFLKYVTPLNELLLGVLSGITINGLVVNYGMLLTGNSKLLEVPEQIKIVKYYCLIPGIAALFKIALKLMTPTPVKLTPITDMEQGHINFTVKKNMDSQSDPFENLKEIFPHLERKDLPKLNGWDWLTMAVIMGFNGVGNIGMNAWWLPVLFSKSVTMATSKIAIGCGSFFTASKEIKYFSLHCLNVKSLKLIASQIPNKNQREAEILKKNPLHGIRYIKFASANTILSILVAVVVASLLHTTGISDIYPHFLGGRRLSRYELAGVFLFYFACNLVIFITNSSRAATNRELEKSLEEAIEEMNPADKSPGQLVLPVSSGIAMPSAVQLEAKDQRDISSNGMPVPVNSNVSNTVNIDLKNVNEPQVNNLDDSKPQKRFSIKQQSSFPEIGPDPVQPTVFTPLLKSSSKDKKKLECSIM